VNPHEVWESQSLRHRVFAQELGAQVEGDETGVDHDPFDKHCHHLLVREVATGQVVASTRILTDRQSRVAGGFYSETEFHIRHILSIPGSFMEVGRTCVHPDYRKGAAIGLLWAGLARFMVMNRFDYLMGCASVPLTEGIGAALALYQRIARTHLTPEYLRVFPRHPLPPMDVVPTAGITEPPLLKAYLRLGARVCGEPCWDPDFNVADVFILLAVERLANRYVRHFVQSDRCAVGASHGQWA
jgi:putative hemolysin